MGHLFPLSPAQCVEVSGSVWAPGSGGGYPRCPPAAPDAGSVQGSESSEGCHEASFLLLFCFLRLKLALYSCGFHLQLRGLGPSPGDFPSVWGGARQLDVIKYSWVILIVAGAKDCCFDL